MTDETDPWLLAHPLVASLRPEERATVLAVCERRELPAGTMLRAHGAPGDGLDLLLEGQVQVSVEVDGQPHEVALLDADSWVGELSVLGDDGAAADVVAVTDVVIAHIPPKDLASLLELDALHLQLDAVARRRRAVNRSLRLPPVAAGEVAGRPLQLRPLWPEDWRQLATRQQLVSPESLRLRFFSPPPMTERTFRRFTATDHSDQFAWGAIVDGELLGIGRHALQAEDRGVAEVAVLVADHLQGHGVGRRLVAAVTAAAAVHGADELYALARTENAAVRALLERFGASWRPAGDGTVSARWPVDAALAVPGLAGLVADAAALAAAVLAEVVEP